MRAVGVPDEKSGEAVKLYVVRRDLVERIGWITAGELHGLQAPAARGVRMSAEVERRKILRRELRGLINHFESAKQNAPVNLTGGFSLNIT